jgi:RNAse (barnase) inhibitor barstar
MDAQPAAFVFGDNLPELGQEDIFVARILGAIATRDQLFAVLARELRLPSYFGGNWDALSDCLRDLSWIEPRRVIIDHEAVPVLDTVTLRAYLEVLRDCATDWKPGEEHELLVRFPASAEARIRGIMKGGSADS